MDSSNNNNAPQISTRRLDDEARVRVISPSMLVIKRFLRNRLAIVGLVIILVMFAFSFLGALVMPYSQSQVFRKNDWMLKDYASMMVNEELRYTVAEGETLSLAARSQFVLALSSAKNAFTADKEDYAIVQLGEDSYAIARMETLGTALKLKNNYAYKATTDASLSEDVIQAFEAAEAAGETSFSLNGEDYTIYSQGKNLAIGKTSLIATATMRIFDAFELSDSAVVSSFPFRLSVERAIEQQSDEFTAEGVRYTIHYDEDRITVQKDAVPFAIVSKLISQPSSPDVKLTVAFKEAVFEAINAGKTTFLFAENGEEVQYTLTKTRNTYSVKKQMITELIDIYATPSRDHLLGTDANGMDVLTRLMHGGRVSLMVGFVVVILELLIGVVLGGIAGYFGGKIDTLLMRFIDVFNCVPSYPVLIIIGAVMDKLEVDPYVRLFILMGILGLLGWTGIARVVRGQILSLREQDFMIAAEATGIRVSRRIFRHLVPNVMALLIVHATLNLGGIIITEATLSFLGLGLKYPMASWGTIISAATNIFVMTNYWFIWMPAGVLILLTVLGFNFVGDGLRDAFDPKMKR